MDNKMSEQYTNVRIESKSMEKMKRAVKHSLRMIKISSNQKYIRRVEKGKVVYVYNPNHMKHNMFWINGIDGNSFTKEERREVGKELINKFKSRQEEHAKRLMTSQGKYLDKKRVKSFADGVLTFSNSMIELAENDKEKIFELGVKTIKNIAEKLDVEVHYITFDLDEIGTPHFQYYFDSFDSKGNALNIAQSKKGSMLQDLGEIEFKELGFSRGIKKEVSGRHNIPNGAYQDFKDDMKDKDIEHNEMANIIYDLKNEVADELVKLEKEYKYISDFYKAHEYKDELEEFTRLWLKYKQKKNIKRATKHIKKNMGKVEKYERIHAAANKSGGIKKTKKQGNKNNNNNYPSPKMELKP